MHSFYRYVFALSSISSHFLVEIFPILYMLCSHYRSHRQDNSIDTPKITSDDVTSPVSARSAVVRLQTFVSESAGDTASDDTANVLDGN